MDDDDDSNPDSNKVIKIEPNDATGTQGENNTGVWDDKESRSAGSPNGGESDDSKSRSGNEAAEESNSETKDTPLFEQPLLMEGKRKVKVPTNLYPSSIKNQPYPENQSHDAYKASLQENEEQAKSKDTKLLDNAIKSTKPIRTKQCRKQKEEQKEVRFGLSINNGGNAHLAKTVQNRS